MMINGVNLNSESLHKNLILSTQKMAETKSTLPQKNTFANFTSMGGSREINEAPNMTLNDLKNGMHATHVRLQNNGWNYENFCRLYKNNVTHTNNNNNNNNNLKNNNNNNNQNNFNNKNLIKMVEMKEQSSKRTQDQENAFRCIEDVHNYAKVKAEDSEFLSGESSRSSRLDDDEDDDDDEEATEDSTETVDLEQKHKSLRTDNTLMSHLKYIKKYRLIKRDLEEDMHIDVETVPQEEELHSKLNLECVKKDCKTTTPEPEIAPDHHARRPMNAFLIFCKRHRAIVKDRYKTLENRAITKILGDWWASLDADDKECFTNLAQQNKDAFFSANPNFKWYKLPAPPLRSLRANSSEIMNEYPSSSTEFLSGDDSQNNYFKLADETQMGDLSTLLTHSEKRKQKHIKNDHAALQQALGETTQFFNKQMQSVKRSYVDNNNVAEMDEFLPKKTSRSCKGKKYQELMQSGQIAASAKKTKGTLPKQQQQQQQQQQQLLYQQAYDKQQQHQADQQNDQQQQQQDEVKSKQNDDQQVVEKQEQQLVDSKVFDLEEKIKELPALSLDLYLQRKRNVKKKRKINAKKSNNSSHSNATTTTTTTTSVSVTSNETENKNNNNNNKNKNNNNLMKAQDCKITVRAVVVGSQKRKARKESITRRDVSSVENEVTAVLPMSSTVHYNNIRGNFYFDDTVTSTTYANGLSARSENVAKSIMFNNETFNNCNKAIPPTSDLLILAEVAEKTSCY